MDTKILEMGAGVVMPFIIDLVNRKVESTKLRYFISMAICLLLGFLLNLDKLNASDVLVSGSVIFTAAQTVYKTYYEKSQLRKAAFGIDTTGTK